MVSPSKIDQVDSQSQLPARGRPRVASGGTLYLWLHPWSDGRLQDRVAQRSARQRRGLLEGKEHVAVDVRLEYGQDRQVWSGVLDKVFSPVPGGSY